MVGGQTLDSLEHTKLRADMIKKKNVFRSVANSELYLDTSNTHIVVTYIALLLVQLLPHQRSAIINHHG